MCIQTYTLIVDAHIILLSIIIVQMVWLMSTFAFWVICHSKPQGGPRGGSAHPPHSPVAWMRDLVRSSVCTYMYIKCTRKRCMYVEWQNTRTVYDHASSYHEQTWTQLVIQAGQTEKWYFGRNPYCCPCLLLFSSLFFSLCHWFHFSTKMALMKGKWAMGEEEEGWVSEAGKPRMRECIPSKAFGESWLWGLNHWPLRDEVS